MSAIEQELYPWLITGGIVTALIIFVTLLLIPAPYGRHTRQGWGPSTNSRLGWILMELTSASVFAGCFLWGWGVHGGGVWILTAMWEIHYINRSLVFPFRMRESGKRTPMLIVLFGMLFNVFNGYINGRYLGVAGAAYNAGWLTGPRFMIGAALFAVGMAINLHADEILFRLRQPGERDYKIPHGGLYRWISCPNYFGEVVEWTGWAVATWSWPGLVFAVWTAANLVPRALAHHRWYRHRFIAYPPERRAIIPLLL